jgi:hypothetical protein
MTHRLVMTIGCAILLLGGAPIASAQQAGRSEVEELKRLLEQQEEAIRALKSRIEDLERRPGAIEGVPVEEKVAPPAPPPVVAEPGEAPSPAEEAEAVAFPRTEKSRVAARGNLDDRQEAAARPGDYVLDPTYRGFIPIPRTVFMVKFNPKPRVDMMVNNRNPGAPYRFVPARLPIQGTPDFGDGEQFNGTANGSQLRVDMRAPSLGGNFRLYYQNDFFGDEQRQMRYRLQHLYGQYHGVVAGFTYGVFEDPDSWPDTVDYEGPNSLIFARRPVLHYTASLAEDWNLTLGVEDPGLAIDNTGNPDGSSRQRAPDTGFNVRWEPGALGHAQFSTILRSLTVTGGDVGTESAFGWGVNLGGSLALTDNDTMQFLGVVGEGVGGLGNDAGFDNTDAAINSDGDLVALPYQSAMIAFTHNWTPRWRSTGTYGYVHIHNTSLQGGGAYHETHYGSLNLVYQVYKRLSVGVEGLYGFREVHSGNDTDDVFRVNLGAVYSPFD